MKDSKPNWRAECGGSYISVGVDADGVHFVKSDAPFKVSRRRGIRWEHPSKRAGRVTV